MKTTEMQNLSPRRKQTNNTGIIGKIVSEFLICMVIFLVLAVIRICPDGKLTEVKNTVSLILTQNIDIIDMAKNLKKTLIPDKNIEAMNPVAEFTNPVPQGEIVRRFGVQDASDGSFHYGIDIKAKSDANVYSCASGEVVEIATNTELGAFITIKHSDEIFTTYAHLGEIISDVKEKVSAGQAIARVDEDVVYFELKRSDTYLNPEEFIDFGADND